MSLTPDILAADIHKRMADDNRFGYSWAERYGAFKETWRIDGKTIVIKVGDYDCSSSAITAWTLALMAFGLGDVLSGATFTGNIKYVFLRTGLFEWRTDFANAKKGDLFLNEALHVAICQGNGKLSEFSSSETGGIYGKRGDQTNWEAHVTNYYNYPWDGYLHYIGKLGDDDEVTEQDKKDIAKMAADEFLNRTLSVNGEKKAVPVWQLFSWTFYYIKDLFKRK